MELPYLLLWIVLQATLCTCKVVVHKADISVKIGRSVYLRPEDLYIETMENEKCRVEVITNDPITQRVGHLEPQVFDCTFLEKSVRYLHSGNPLLTEDRIKLRAHKFTRGSTVSETFYLKFKIQNESYEIIHTKGHKSLTVSEMTGMSNSLDSSVIHYNYISDSNISCSIGFSKYNSEWPLVGQIVMGEKGKVVEAIKRDCHEFLLMDLRYEHLKSPSPAVDYLPLVIDLYDPSSKDEISESFFLPIFVQNAFPNSPPRASFKSMYIMDVDQFILTTLIPGVISAEDYETPASQLVFNISKPPGDGNGYLVKLDDHTQPITSFIQDDLDSLRIGYQPPNTSYAERKVYEVEFTVYDSHFSASMPIKLHIAVRPSVTTAPRISYNKGLVLLEGERRPILPNNLQIVDQDNVKDVKIYVKGGLNYGQLKVNGSLLIYFTVRDLADGNVVYEHDDSDSTRDNIELRITDQTDTVRASFPITIIPKDDTPPYVVNNLGLELNEGAVHRIGKSLLLAHDSDTLDSRIIYSIVKTTRAGEIIFRQKPTDKGRHVKKFTQLNLMQGQIYYRHIRSGRFRDSFDFVLKDQESPPNVSPKETFQIIINSINDNPPILSPTATQFMQIQETNIGYISKAQLDYFDKDSKESQLVYTITTQPHFVYNSKRADAGRVITTHNITMLRKDLSLPMTKSFTQKDINHLKVAYVPPANDIGTEPCLVRFIYMIEDFSGNRISGQQFDIEVQPVDNQSPEFITNKLLVEEGGTIGITTSQISAMDIDTLPSELSFVCGQLPQYGMLQKNGINLKKEDHFKLADLKEKAIRYIQDGSEVTMDSFSLTLTDGIHRVTKDINIDIVPIDDQAPRLRDGLKPHLIVSEGNDAVVTPSVLSAKDDDTDDELLTFLIVKQPSHGTIKVNGYPVTKFTQQNIKEKIVKYDHIGGEIGPTPQQDSVTFIVSDQNYASAVDLPIYDLNITITPVDNQKPEILTGNPILLQEGKTFQITMENLNAEDIDTLPKSIRFMIVKQPQWGYLENTKPNPGSEKSNAGIQINSFRLQDVMDKSINYVQSNHIGVEPLYDSIELYAMDGKLHSETKTLAVNIVPTNDEIPDVMLQDFAVLEGGTKIINQSIVDAIDLDVPKDQLTFSISKPPKFGEIVVMLQSKTGDVEAPVGDFSIKELQRGMRLKYKHDDSENFHDRFVLVVSDGKHAVKKTCNITIIPVNDEKPSIMKNSGLNLGHGNFGLLTNQILLAEDKDTDPSNLNYVLISLPKVGSLQFRTESDYPPVQARWYDFEMGANFTQDDINNSRIRYIHNSDVTQTKTDRFTYVLTDGVNKVGPDTFEFHIKNSQTAKIALLNKGLKIKEGARAILSTDILSASDGSTKAEEIIFTITKAPTLGQLEFINAPFVPIKGFTQLDLIGQQVVYNHISKSDITEDYFSFTVTNGLKYSRDDQLLIYIETQDEMLPTLEVNNPIEVIQGSEVTITTLHLKITDPDTSVRNLTYKIIKPPIYGHLYNKDVVISHSFTQYDIDRGYIAYENDGTHAGLDHFLFLVTDGHHSGFYTNTSVQTQPVISNVFIKSLSQDAPQLQVNRPPENLELFGKDRYGFKLSSEYLKSFDSDTDNSHLMYIITKRPEHGHIENTAAKRYVHRKFRQKDLDDNTLLYIINPKSDAVNDSFSFRLEDFNGNTLDGQKFEFKWSRTGFLLTDYVTCENIGTLSLTLIRAGDVEKSAFVGIRVRPMSAKAQNDFIPSTAKQVQFDPGMMKATWSVLIEADKLKENNEKFKVILHNPVNTIIGKNGKTTVQIINAVNGKCPQYIGMISKDHPEPLTKTSNHIHIGKNLPLQFNPFPKLQLLDSPGEENKQFEVAQTKPKKSKQNGKGGKKGKKSKKGKKKSKKSKNKKASVAKSPMDKNLGTEVVTEGSLKGAKICTETTKDLLFLDMASKKLYRCDGKQWREWHFLQGQKDEQPQSSVCEQGWAEFQGQCYKFVNEKVTWNDAELVCRGSYTAHLASVLSRKHHRWMGNLSGKNSFWIGLNDKSDTGNWVYMTGDPVRYTKWRQGRPRIKRTAHKKNCVLVNRRLKWANKKCDRPKAKFICQKAALPKHMYRNLPSHYRMRQRRYFSIH